MTSVLLPLLLTVRGLPRSRIALHLEVLALRHQLQVLQRSRPRRLRSRTADRWLWVWLSRVGPRGERRSSSSNRRPSSPGIAGASDCSGRGRVVDAPVDRPSRADVRALIRTMSQTNPLWGAPRIHGELVKLGIAVCQATVAKYMVAPSPTTLADVAYVLGQPHPPNHRRGFLRRADGDVPAPVRPGDPRARAATRRSCGCHRPSDGGMDGAATPRGVPVGAGAAVSPPRSRPRVRRVVGHRRQAMGIEDVRTAARSPWQNAYVERFIGSVRRECLDHVIVVSATRTAALMLRLLPLLRTIANASLARQGRADSPPDRAAQRADAIVAIPQVGGLHHRYERRAA